MSDLKTAPKATEAIPGIDRDSVAEQVRALMAAPLLHDIPQAAVKMNCRERWLLMQLRAGRFPARKVQRQWRMTDDDIAAAIEICAVTPPPPESVSLADQLTDRSRRAAG